MCLSSSVVWWCHTNYAPVAQTFANGGTEGRSIRLVAGKGELGLGVGVGVGVHCGCQSSFISTPTSYFDVLLLLLFLLLLFFATLAVSLFQQIP